MKKTKILIIGGNRFVGLRLVYMLENEKGNDVHVLNRTGQVAHSKHSVLYKGDRKNLERSHLDRDWDIIFDFAAFDATDVRASLAYFKNVGRYIFISTASVYDAKADMKEERFDLKAWTFHDEPTEEEKEGLYQFGKRQAESLFAHQAGFPVLMVRFPIILGPDDYTRRLEFHVERIREGKPLFFPNLEARISLIHSEDAAAFLHQTATDLQAVGPLNVASPEPIQLKALLELIARKEGKKPILMKKETPEIYSPFGADQDWYMNTEKLQKMGYKIKPIKAWLPTLIESLSTADKSTIH